MILLQLVTETHPHAKVALPVAASLAALDICRRAGVPVTITKFSSADLMEVASNGEITFAANQAGGFIFPDFLPAFDAAATLVQLVSMLAVTGSSLSKMVRDLPPVHIAHQTVVTPWEQKGLVMRTLVEQMQERDLVLIDGVKIPEDGGWALVIPDPEEPLTHIWAEGSSEIRSRILADQYAVRLQELLR